MRHAVSVFDAQKPGVDLPQILNTITLFDQKAHKQYQAVFPRPEMLSGPDPKRLLC